MFAVFDNDRRECQVCHKPGDEIDDPVMVEDPDADPNVLTMHMKFCSMECAQKWVDEYVVQAKEATDDRG